MNNNADALIFTHKVCVEAPQTLRSHRRIRLREILLACLRAKRFDMVERLRNELQQSLISVIVPVYNMKEYLARCVDTILAQTFSNMQILLVDDGSTDGSDLLCDQIAHPDKRISALHIEHAGPGAARNRGIREAKGRYVTFVDSDDWIAPDMLESMLKVMIREKADLVTCDLTRTSQVMPSFPGNRDKAPAKTEIYTQEEYMRVFFRIGSNEWVHFPVAKLYKREHLSPDLYPEGIFIGEDVMSTFRVLMKTQRIVHIPKVYYYYYRNPNSATAIFSRRDFDLLEVWDGVAKTCRREGKYYSYAKLNRDRLNYTLLMRMAIAVPYEEILRDYGNEYERLYKELRRNEKMLLRAPIPLSRKLTILMMCRSYRLACAGGSVVRSGEKALETVRRLAKKNGAEQDDGK